MMLAALLMSQVDAQTTIKGSALPTASTLTLADKVMMVTDPSGTPTTKTATLTLIKATLAAGSGDVVGPASAVGNRVVFFDGTTGKLVKDSGLTLSGTNTGDQDLSGYLSTATAATTYQPLDADLTSWAGISAAANVGTFLASPSSANFASAITDETGSDFLVMSNAPTLTNPISANYKGAPYSGTSGFLQLSGGFSAASNGGQILLNGGGLNAHAGIINLSGGSTMFGGVGGTLNSQGGDSGADGGDLLMYGATLPGGNIATFDGGGSIDTRGTGSIQFGALGTRTTLVGSAATSDKTITMPNATGTILLTDGNGSALTGINASNISSGSLALARIAQDGATNGQVLSWNGTAWAPAAGGGGLTINTTGITGGTSGRLLTSGTTVGELTLGSGVSTFLTTPTLANLNAATTDADAAGLGANTFTGALTLSVAGAASAPSLYLTGALNVGGTGTTTFPHIFHQPTGATAATTWSSGANAGTVIGANEATGFVGNFVDGRVAGAAAVRIDHLGNYAIGTINAVGIRSDTGQVTFRHSGGSSSFLSPVAAGNIGLSVASACGIGWTNDGSISATGGFDTVLYRAGLGSIQLGANAAAPVAQTLKAHNGSGTNIDGAPLNLSGGLSTGTADDGDLIFNTTMTGASSGSSVNTYQTRQHVQAKFVNLTEATATNVTSISLPSGKVTGGTATVTVWASDGTDHQTLTSQIRFGAVNKAGTLTTTCNQTDGTTAASAGTLTVTYDTAASGANLLIRANATSSLTQTVLRCRIVINGLNGDDVQTVTPQ